MTVLPEILLPAVFIAGVCLGIVLAALGVTLDGDEPLDYKETR